MNLETKEVNFISSGFQNSRIKSSDMSNTVLTIARFTVIEAWRSRWGWMLLGCVLLCLSFAAFVAELALHERKALVLAMLAPLVRLLSVMLVVLLTVAAVVREFNERSIMLMLAAPISRSTWLLGKAFGFILVAAVTAMTCALPIWILQPGLAAFTWTLSLMLELSLVACGSLLVASVLRQVPIAALVMAAFYGLGRVLGVLSLLAQRSPVPAVEQASLQHMGLFGLLERVLPRLDLFAQTSWLLESVPVAALSTSLTQVAIYLPLLWVVARIDVGAKEV